MKRLLQVNTSKPLETEYMTAWPFQFFVNIYIEPSLSSMQSNFMYENVQPIA